MLILCDTIPGLYIVGDPIQSFVNSRQVLKQLSYIACPLQAALNIHYLLYKAPFTISRLKSLMYKDVELYHLFIFI